MRFFDSHTHIQFPLYDQDQEEVLSRAKAAGVRMIVVGTQAASSQAAVELAKKRPGEVWAAVGFHPNHLASIAPQAPVLEGARKPEGVRDGGRGFVGGWYHDKKEQVEAERESFDASKLRKIAENKEVVAIGEFGLDYYRLSSDMRQVTGEKEKQRGAFEEQVQMAKDLNKAMMLHCRPSYVKTSEGKPRGTDDAYEDALKILMTYDKLPTTVFHFYVGSPVATKKLLEMGAYFTFGGVVTFSRDYDEVIKMIPLDRIFLETDAPYVAPEPNRGKRNEPAYIVETYKKFAELKNESLEKVSEQIAKNVLQVFKINI